MNDHTLMIGQSFTSDGYTASCTCGWEGRREHDDQAGAVDEWEFHCDAVFAAATEPLSPREDT